MPLRNRVTPLGEIIADAARGTVMGNRGGRIHDGKTRTLTGRRWASRRWIVCVTDFRGRQRTVMSPESYTELFFLDEVTALAAGHRPCFECRNRDAKAFASAFSAGRKIGSMGADEMDRHLHRERCISGAGPTGIKPAEIDSLPVGAMIEANQVLMAATPSGWLVWTISGYRSSTSSDMQQMFQAQSLRLLTPGSTVAALRAGYTPQFHPSATA
ncbi:hypothetical protein [Hoeflea prorocentri]|uniref:Uncharacterized protein n=1 Tax=Hoeflea prorocentri TaxID=1922333 RepID=A0A9X3ZIT1_9HYPH|nr:hypothetical protein [Hoeflea prorocentri]MCY6382333.1 hypothetical protein [Hoeflea prorocentri]MDA5400133.1 hypothetical protein [Hoeflea prorocentri]